MRGFSGAQMGNEEFPSHLKTSYYAGKAHRRYESSYVTLLSMGTHTGERPFQCKKPGSRFAWTSHLDIHILLTMLTHIVTLLSMGLIRLRNVEVDSPGHSYFTGKAHRRCESSYVTYINGDSYG